MAALVAAQSGAQVILADIDVANGNIHFIDTVLMP